MRSSLNKETLAEGALMRAGSGLALERHAKGARICSRLYCKGGTRQSQCTAALGDL